MKIVDILKNLDIPSKDINSRFKSNQILLNNEVVDRNFEIDIEDFIMEGGDFLFYLPSKLQEYMKSLKNIGIDFKILFNGETNISGKLTEFLSGFQILQVSKRDYYILMNKNE